MLCNRPMVQPFNTFNNQTTNVFNNNYTTYNRYTNINQTFINNENAQLSVNNNITVNNYNQIGQKKAQPGKIGQFLCGYRTPKVGCGCSQSRFGYGNYFGTNGSVRRFCSNIAGKLRNFMNFRYSNV